MFILIYALHCVVFLEAKPFKILEQRWLYWDLILADDETLIAANWLF